MIIHLLHRREMSVMPQLPNEYPARTQRNVYNIPFDHGVGGLLLAISDKKYVQLNGAALNVGPFHQPPIYALGSQNVAHSLVLR